MSSSSVSSRSKKTGVIRSGRPEGRPLRTCFLRLHRAHHFYRFGDAADASLRLLRIFHRLGVLALVRVTELAPAVPRGRGGLERLHEIRGRRHHPRLVVQVEPDLDRLAALEARGLSMARAESDARRPTHGHDGRAEGVAVQRHLHGRAHSSEHGLGIERQFDEAGAAVPLDSALEHDMRRLALGHADSAISARTVPACSHCAWLTSRWVTARSVRGPNANSSTPCSRARATSAAASGAPSATRKTTMFVWTVARSSTIPDDDASRRASTAALAWSVTSCPP